MAAYDEVYYIADAIHRAGGTEPEKVVDALWRRQIGLGTVGHIKFTGKDDPFDPHA